MCGIVGILSLDGSYIDQRILEKMRDTMIHRGPDDSGVFIVKNVGLAHRRLSIIDLSGGHQPMSNEDGTVWITYNGEVYNFKDLYNDLSSRGHNFKTKSDTEVIIHAYEEYGMDCVHKFNGMFAFAIWDSRHQLLWLARDRLGVKPLYYTIWNGKFIFASEIKAIIAYDEYPREVNSEIIREYLIFRFVAGSATFFKHIFNMLPGHILKLKDGKLEIRKYWDIEFDNENFLKDKDAAVKTLDQLLSDSVSKRLISDVPLGTFNSGGIDSSLITAYACLKKNEALHTFSVGFYEKEFDESYYAKKISEKYQTIHHELRVGGSEFADLLPKMIYYNDEPLNHPNSILIYKISKLAKNYVTVVLTGEGADELFAGYPRYLIPKLLRIIEIVPLMSLLLKILKNLRKSHRIAKLTMLLDEKEENRLLYNSSFINPKISECVLNQKIKEDDLAYRLRILQSSNFNSLNQLLYLDIKTYLVSILLRQDKMSMAASIESRVPYLDYRIAEFSFKIDPELKQNILLTKYVLRKVAGSYLDSKIIRRRKSGFGVPLFTWLRNKNYLGRYFELLDNPQIDCIDYNKIRKTLKGKTDKVDYTELAWCLINLELWHRIFVKDGGRL